MAAEGASCPGGEGNWEHFRYQVSLVVLRETRCISAGLDMITAFNCRCQFQSS